jgi:signal transduction histidine kinase
VIDFGKRPAVDGAKSFFWHLVHGRLFWKYVVLFVAVTGSALLANSLIDIWFTYRDLRTVLIRAQNEQADAAAAKITQFIKEIEGQLGWTTYLSWAVPATEQRELDGIRLLRQVPAISELTLLDDQGREQLRLSRQVMDRVGGNIDFSADERFKEAVTNKVYYGPVKFRHGTEPFMTLAVAGARSDAGVSAAEVNLTFIWDIVNHIRVGRTGKAYVVDAQGRLIAHPDISLVLRNTDLSHLTQVRSVLAGAKTADTGQAATGFDVYGERVLATYAKAPPLNWFVFVELPEREANEPLYAAIERSSIIVLSGLILALSAALLLSRLMVIPIQTLTAGAASIGAGSLDHRITIKTGDELQTLGEQLNVMATQLQGSYATLERKVDERTHQLQLANLAKSRFLAAASHDLRQPLHALNLFVAQLRTEKEPAEQNRLAVRIEAALANMNELFNALLDISKLDAGALNVNISEFPVKNILKSIERIFAVPAREKALRFRTVPSSDWVRSDAILLERILLNLVSNAVNYTPTGGIVIGCRHAGDKLRIEVCDSGVGIPKDQQRDIFGEFYRVTTSERNLPDGMGLGLAIVERLSNLLDHPFGLVSTPGKGSRFYVTVPLAQRRDNLVGTPTTAAITLDPLHDKLIVIIDDDALVLDGTGGLLKSWGCRVVTAKSDRDALAGLDCNKPDLIISDFRLKDGKTGIDAVAQLRDAFHAAIPAFLISGDILPERLRETQAAGLHLLHKPVGPMTLRTMMSRLLRDGSLPPRISL